MSVRWYSIVVDCHDVAAQARWWAETFDWRLVYEADDEAVIVPPHALDERRDIPPVEQGPGLVFVSVPDDKTVKNRLHIDLSPGVGEGAQDTAVRDLLARGATLADVGQDPEAGWVVLRDPEGNEFCVLSARP